MKESTKKFLAFVAMAIVCTYAFIGGYYYKAAKNCEAQRLSELSQTPDPCSEQSQTSKIVVTQINDWVEPELEPYKIELLVIGDEDLGTAFPWEPCSLLGLKPTSRFDNLPEAWEVPAPEEDFPTVSSGWPVNNKDVRRPAPSAPDDNVNLAPIEYEGIMVGPPDYSNSPPGLTLVPVAVDGHPEIQKAFFDCSNVAIMGAPCAGIQNMMRKNPTKVRIRQHHVAFLANQPVAIWIIEF
jgi:hypothetical protein